MARNKEYRTRVTKTLNFEMNIYDEFQDLCKKEDTSISRKLQDFMIEELQKNALGSDNPIGVLYNLYNKSNKPCQTDLTQWVETVHQHKDNNIMLTRMASLGTAITATANDYIRKNRYRK